MYGSSKGLIFRSKSVNFSSFFFQFVHILNIGEKCRFVQCYFSNLHCIVHRLFRCANAKHNTPTPVYLQFNFLYENEQK